MGGWRSTGHRVVLAVVVAAVGLVVGPVPARATDGPVVVGGTTYILTCAAYPDSGDWDAAAVSEFGAGAVAADFDDVQVAAGGAGFDTFYAWLGTSTSVGVKLGGTSLASAGRWYFMVGHAVPPSSFTIHAYLSATASGDDSGIGVAYPRVNVGSWFFDRRILVDVTAVSPTPTTSCPPEGDPEPEAEAAPTLPVATGPSWVPTPTGSEPSVAPGTTERQDADDVVTSQGPTEGVDGAALRVTYSGAVTRTADGGLFADPGADVVAEVCGPVLPGGVIEAWGFSPPRLVAAARAGDGPCHEVVVRLGASLDGEGPLPSPLTLQLAVPTSSGMQALNTGVTVGRPLPMAVSAGEGHDPVPPAPRAAAALAVTGSLALAAVRRTVRG